MSNLGEEVLLLGKESQNTGLIYLNSGNQYEVPLSILIDENDELLSKKLRPKPLYVYQMISINDSVSNSNLQFRTPIMEVGYK